MVDLTAGASDVELFHIEDGLIEIHKQRLAVGLPADDVEDTYSLIKQEIEARGFITKGLTPVTKLDGPPVTGKHPSEDDGLHTSSGTKRGKGGNANRTEVHALDGEPGEAGDPDNTGHDNVLPGGKAKQNKSPEGGSRTHAKGFGAPPAPPAPGTPPKPPVTPASAPIDGTDNEDPNDQAQDEQLNQNGEGTPSQGPAGEYTPHPFQPSDAIAAICGTCGRPIADHVGKSSGDQWSTYVSDYHLYELTKNGKVDPQVNPLLKRDFTTQERQQFAGNGVALPDGSFPIPDEASLHNAVRLVGHAGDPQSAMQHIIERAKTMGMQHALPPAWNVPDAGMEERPQVPQPGAHSMSPDQAQPGQTSSGPARSPAGGQQRPQGSGNPAPKPAASPGTSAIAPGANPPKPKSNYPGNAPTGFGKQMATAFKKAYDAGLDETAAWEVIETASVDTFEIGVVEKRAEDRYVMGPVYLPDTYDAHGEWATADELAKALTDYVETSTCSPSGDNRNIFFQHSAEPAGKWTQIMQWPKAVQATMQKSVDGVTKAVQETFPAGTVFMGAVLEPWAWDEVKKGRRVSWSMGGWAKRVDAEIARRTN